ncbi:hypothetical protein SBA7_440005 [Candidatus Sulfotelmatobacter sp. SbA7]|nr:hypothetical protein SBA7_440005 [Candidatus Sulfotelmatobacter sp. SbA7]
MTDPIYGSTLSIPEHFWLTSSKGGCNRKYKGETQSRGDFASSPLRETIPPKWMEKQKELSGGFPWSGLARHFPQGESIDGIRAISALP